MFDFLRDPIWQGIAAIIAILAFLVAIGRRLIPGFREALSTEGLRRLTARIVNSTGCMVAIIIGCVLPICLLVPSPLSSGLLGILATAKPTASVTPAPPPTATPSPTPVYTWLFYDGFDNGVSPNWVPVSGTWQMVNNRYTMTNVGSDWTSGLTLVGDTGWTDYHLGVEVGLPTSNQLFSIDNRAVVVVRAQDASNFLALVLNNLAIDSKANQGTWMVVADGKNTTLSNTTFSIDSSQTIYVEIDVQGNVVTTSVNGAVVNRWSGTQSLSGKVGLGIISMNPGSPPWFDDVSVRRVAP